MNYKKQHKGRRKNRSRTNRRGFKLRRNTSSMKRKAKRADRTRGRKRAVRRGRKYQIRRPTTARQYLSMSAKQQETWDSIAYVITRIRDGVSLAKASKEAGIGPEIVVVLGRPALRKRQGRYIATKTDHLLRMITILTVKGRKVLATRDSRQASLVGSHWAAVQMYLQTGDDSALLRFKGKKVTDASGKRHLLLTDLAEINRLASAGVLSFESMYAAGSL